MRDKIIYFVSLRRQRASNASRRGVTASRIAYNAMYCSFKIKSSDLPSSLRFSFSFFIDFCKKNCRLLFRFIYFDPVLLYRNVFGPCGPCDMAFVSYDKRLRSTGLFTNKYSTSLSVDSIGYACIGKSLTFDY